MPWLPALVVIVLVYNFSGYLFASLTAHTVALYVPMLTVAVAVGAPPLFAALLLAFFSSLCVSLTHYAGGPSPVYFGSNYVSLRRWWGIGLLVGVLNIGIWLGIGSAYWKMLGLY
jgi:DASS family divalent anion:Na+ symporter